MTDGRTVRVRSCAALVCVALLVPTHGFGQSPPPPAQTPRPEPPVVGISIGADVIRDLPASNVAALIETTQAESVADRFNGGGLAAGGTSHLVSFLGSRRQTRYRLGDADVTSPTTGEALVFPEIAFWRGVSAATASMALDTDAPSLAVSLDPVRPSPQWTATVEGFRSGPGLVAGAKSIAPPVARLHDWTQASALAGGPLGSRARLAAGGALSRGRNVPRGRPDLAREEARSAFVQLATSPSRDGEWRSLGLVQGIRAPSPRSTAENRADVHDSVLHVQSAYEAAAAGARPSWRVFGGYTHRKRDEDPLPRVRVADRLADGPIGDLLGGLDGIERRWSFGGGIAPAARGAHRLTLAAGIRGSRHRLDPAAPFTIGESIDGGAARVWHVPGTNRESSRGATAIAAYVGDLLTLSPALSLDAAVSVERVTGHANGSVTDIVWYSLLPRVMARWSIGTRAGLTLFTGYRRSANELSLDLLAFGDPAGPVASVFRWDAAAMGDARTLVARAGPGTGGDPGFSRIDPDLARPHTDELVIALQSSPSATARLGVAGVARREGSIVAPVNIGVPLTSYTTFLIPDPNVDLAGAQDDQQLLVYNQRPDTLGSDRYLLTNTDEDAAAMGAVVVTAEVTTPRLFVLVGATASASVGQAASRGFRATENDQDSAGERWMTANALTNARGRLFSDRAYTIKWTTVYRFPGNIRLGAIARYQDGQPFARLAIVSGLSQGTDIVRAFANGRSRFAFTGTLDVRLQKGFAFGRVRIDAIADVYNLLDLSKEVEEYVVTGPRYRSPTAAQPPRAMHVGMRVAF